MPLLFLALLVLAEPNLAETRLSGYAKSSLLVNKVEKMRTIGGLEPTKDISDKLRIIDKE